MDHKRLNRSSNETSPQYVGEVPVEVELPKGAELECLAGQLWFTVRPLRKDDYVDDKFLVHGEKFLASQYLRIWVSSFRREPAEFLIRRGI